jgi:hypothetical protein
VVERTSVIRKGYVVRVVASVVGLAHGSLEIRNGRLFLVVFVIHFG